MNFKAFLREMTLKAGNLDPDLQRIFADYSDKIVDDELEHVGDIEHVKIMRRTYTRKGVDFLVSGKTRIGFASWNIILTGAGEVFEVDNIYLIPNEQRKDLGYKYFFFLKNVMGVKILLGNVHSNATQFFLQKQQNLKRFDISWLNLKTGERAEFDQDKYDLTKPTDWRVLIESDEAPFMSKFHVTLDDSVLAENYHYFSHHYDWLFRD